ncbi:hypothetical protein RRG08_033658 [Elysia crispata]|uniref:Apple domain-containing protein n=1 Tax=Elysia crispata TaxID=231223 RepID=A0AAE0YLT9_9GAST|nr:hypothetical protein RRG08_033658 [Elysia crispata]
MIGFSHYHDALLYSSGPHLERFYATPYSIVLQENHKKLEKVEPDRCAQACLEETAFVCRSFDYQVFCTSVLCPFQQIWTDVVTSRTLPSEIKTWRRKLTKR